MGSVPARKNPVVMTKLLADLLGGRRRRLSGSADLVVRRRDVRVRGGVSGVSIPEVTPRPSAGGAPEGRARLLGWPTSN